MAETQPTLVRVRVRVRARVRVRVGVRVRGRVRDQRGAACTGAQLGLVRLSRCE